MKKEIYNQIISTTKRQKKWIENNYKAYGFQTMAGFLNFIVAVFKGNKK